jgi:hypothetical protein
LKTLILAFAILAVGAGEGLAVGAFSCDTQQCVGVNNRSSTKDATTAVQSLCAQRGLRNCNIRTFEDTCWAVFRSNTGLLFPRPGTTISATTAFTKNDCEASSRSTCTLEYSICDGIALEEDGAHPADDAHPISQATRTIQESLRTMNPTVMSALLDGIWFGVGVLIVLLAYAKRAILTNFVIHGNLPLSLKHPADDIQVLFRRSQRINWYGRVIFSVTAQLGLTGKQLSLVRRYWLGRVIAFDSLRRQRQNELARLHLQLALKAESRSKDQKALSQIFAFIRTLLLMVFWLIRAVFSFFFGFLFIRVTLAKLVRGTLIESKDLVLLLQAKEEIESTSKYLKEYLELAETFDEREELHEPK